ncbi:DNA-binding transcriptional LysR family regulator [Paraburkholderia youngii]
MNSNVPLLGGLEEAAASAAQGTTAVRGRLRVNMDPFFSRLVLGPRLGSFIDKHPDLQLELITRDQLGDMVADGFDVAIRFGDPRCRRSSPASCSIRAS